MSRERSLWRALVLVLVLGLSVSCGDDGGPGDGIGPVSPLGDAAAVLSQTVDKFFDNNEPAFNSLQFFAPFLQGVLNVAPGAAGPAMSASIQQGCIDPAAFGTTFEFNFQQNMYFAGQMTGAPTDGVRFLLYEGQQVKGHLDIRCPGDLPTINITITVVWDGVTVFSMTGTGSFNPTSGAWTISTTGTVRDPLSSDVLGFTGGGSGVGTQLLLSGYDLNIIPSEQVFASFGRNDQSGVFVSALVGRGLSETTFDWQLELEYSGTSAQSLSGRVLLFSRGDNGVVGCLSGSFDAVVVSEASGCDDEFVSAVSGVTSAQRAALGAGYDALRLIWETLTGILQTGAQIALRSVG